MIISDAMPSSSPRILVVDDLEDNRNLLQVLLESEGYQVELAEEGYSAIAKIEQRRPDLILLDIMMPGLDGCDVAQWVAKNYPFLPILFVTGFGRECCGDRVNVLSDLIHKPIAFDELLDKTRSLLAASKQGRRSDRPIEENRRQ